MQLVYILLRDHFFLLESIHVLMHYTVFRSWPCVDDFPSYKGKLCVVVLGNWCIPLKGVNLAYSIEKTMYGLHGWTINDYPQFFFSFSNTLCVKPLLHLSKLAAGKNI